MRANLILSLRLLGVCFIVFGVSASIYEGNQRVFSVLDDRLVGGHMEPANALGVADIFLMLWRAIPAAIGALLCIFSSRIAKLALPARVSTASTAYLIAFSLIRLVAVLIVSCQLVELLDSVFRNVDLAMRHIPLGSFSTRVILHGARSFIPCLFGLLLWFLAPAIARSTTSTDLPVA